MGIRKLVLLISAFIYSSASFAILCPTNFTEIHMGESVADVKAACGKPDSEATSEDSDEGPQEWNYYVSVNQAFYQNVSQNSQATLKTTIAFDKGKITNMSVNGVGVSNTAICGNSIQIGDTMEATKAACGKPAFINRGTGSQAGTENGDAKAKSKNTTLTYSSGGNSNTTTLVFDGGVLTARK
jgi:hypothetical protein